MAKIDYSVTVHNEYETQTINITGETDNSGVIAVADMDSAVQTFANSLLAGPNAPYPLTLDAIHKVTTSTADITI